MSPSYLIQILLPKATGNGQPVSQAWFESILKELTVEFGGATSFVRAPGEGLWRSGAETQRDNISPSLRSWRSSWSLTTGIRCAKG